jgi:hypothetical protein
VENLNDVEFGIDENQEEAPILIAQRQLNIFRQVHIFNKAKRDQFDDELLALPEVVINYIKKMPGGRLLIEHLEDVKTKRGISFVKSTSEDFASPDDTASAPQQPGTGVPAQYVGGSLTMDANFADTFAKSMAEAFKQLPSPTINATGAPALSGDFGQFFEMIAEEIRTSRSSLLDVLKETKNITDSVIASQVSISRILEGILSSQTKGDTDTATMNNRIIASQASITKLLENLYTSNTQKNDEVSTYLNVDNKLQDFRNQLEQSINNSLASIVNHIYDTTNKQAADMAVLDIEKRLATFKSELEADILKSLAQTPVTYSATNNIATPKPVSFKPDSVAPVSAQDELNDMDIEDVSVVYANDDIERKKKKKKKKKKNLEFAESAENILNSVAAPVVAAEPFHNIAQNTISDEKVNGIIRNSQYKHEDAFDNINLDVPPADDFDIEEAQVDDLDLPTSMPNMSEDNVASNNDLWEEKDNKKDHPVEEEKTTSKQDLALLDDLMEDNDGLDFALPEQNTPIEEDTSEANSSIQPTEDLSSLDDLMDDGLDFALPKQESTFNEENSQVNEEDTQPIKDLSSIDDLMNNNIDDQFPVIEEEEATYVEPEIQSSENLSSLDDLMSDGLDFNPSEQVSGAEEETAPIEEENIQSAEAINSLDDLMSNGLDFNPSKQVSDVKEETAPIEEENIQSAENMGSLDDLMSGDVVSESIENEDTKNSNDLDLNDIDEPDSDNLTVNEEDTGQSSRYSAELDKIRAALTSDNIDISSLDEPIALDDYDDDANVSEDDDIAYSSNTSSSHTEIPVAAQPEPKAQLSTPENSSEEEWEWEYVDENGNPIPQDENNANDEDWEWEYVEDDSSAAEDNNKPE